MILPKLALRSLLGAGLRTWLNVAVLSLAFVVIIGMQGLVEGMNQQATQATTEVEIGGGQYWQANYDPQDPLTLADAHAPIPEELRQLVDSGRATPILALQGFLYIGGNFRPVLLKGIDPAQRVLSLPSASLAGKDGETPAFIGSRMAKTAGLKVGDVVTLRWRDARGTFDAEDVRIAQVMSTPVQSVDIGQIWLPLERLQRMARMETEATLVVLARNSTRPAGPVAGWNFKDLSFLLHDIQEMAKSKSAGSAIGYVVLLGLAMLAILDTQVLSIFHRRKEMGTLMALGLSRTKVIQLFTLEGALHAVLAALAGAVYGIPLLSHFMRFGWALPASTDSYGYAIGDRLYPAYSAGLVAGTTLLVLVVTTVVSYLPTRRIAKLKPTDALRGRLT